MTRRRLHAVSDVQAGYPSDVHAQAERAFEAWRNGQRVEMILRYERPSAWQRLRGWLHPP